MAAKVTMQVGPVSLRTKVEPAVDKESSDRFTVCTGEPEGTHPPSRTKQSNFCPVCNVSHSSAFGFAQRGQEVGDQIVVLTTAEIAQASGTPRTGRDKADPIQVGFHSREKVYAATVAGDSVQNIFPDKGYERAYLVLREALRRRPEYVACTIWAPKSSNALWVIEVVGDRLVMTKRCWPEQVRAVPAAADPIWDTREAEVEWFDRLIEITAEDFDLSVYSDQAKVGLADLVASKSQVSMSSVATPRSGEIPDLLASLQASVDAAKKAKAPAKKAPARRPAAKKVAAKKAPAKRVAKKAAAAA